MKLPSPVERQTRLDGACAGALLRQRSWLARSALGHAALIFSRTAGAVPRGAYRRGRPKSRSLEVGSRQAWAGPRAVAVLRARSSRPTLSFPKRACHLWHLRATLRDDGEHRELVSHIVRSLISLHYPASGSRARSIAFASQAEPSRRNLIHRAGVRRTEPGTLFSSTGSARLPLRRGATVVPSPRPFAFFVAIKHHGWSCGPSCGFHGAAT